MKFDLSIEKSQSIILNEMSYFERRSILQYYFKNGIKINENEKAILNICPAQEHESIAIIGALLNDGTPINTFRLRIGSLFSSDISLADNCKKLLTQNMIKQAEDVLFHWEYEFNDELEWPIVELYNNLFKE